MNSDLTNPTPEELEPKLTALLLGELSTEEAAALRERLAADAALAALYQRLSVTLNLVREAVAQPAETAAPAVPRPRMSAEKRERLLARLREPVAPGSVTEGMTGIRPTVIPVEFPSAEPSGSARAGLWLALAASVVAAVGLAAIQLGRLPGGEATDKRVLVARRAGNAIIGERLAHEAVPFPAAVPLGGNGPVEGRFLYRNEAVGGASGGGGFGGGGGGGVGDGLGAEAGVENLSLVESGPVVPTKAGRSGAAAASAASAGAAGAAGAESEAGLRLKPSLARRYGLMSNPDQDRGFAVQEGSGGARGANPEVDRFATSPAASAEALSQGVAGPPSPASATPTSVRQPASPRPTAVGTSVAWSYDVAAGAAWTDAERRTVEEARLPALGQTVTLGKAVESVDRAKGKLAELESVRAPVEPASAGKDRNVSSFYKVSPTVAGGAPGTGTESLARNLAVSELAAKAEAKAKSALGGPSPQAADTLQFMARDGAPAELAKEAMQTSDFGRFSGLARAEQAAERGGKGAEIRGRAEREVARVALEVLALADAPAVSKPASREAVPALLQEQLETRPPAPPAPVPALEPQPEVTTADEAFSTFSLNVTDVAFKLAAESLEQGNLPSASTVRVEEFLNAFQYRDPEPTGGMPVGFTWERARYPFAHNREALRLAVRTAAKGRDAGRPLNLVLAVDNSGSMERADRVAILREAMRTLAAQLRPTDQVSVVAFARLARLSVDGLTGDRAGDLVDAVGRLTPEGGTNLEDALRVAYETALKHFVAGGVNRVVLLTDGAANLGDVNPESLRRNVESYRKRGVALDCFGIGWEGYHDELLATLSKHGDGRYGFVNKPEDAGAGFAAQLAGALQVAAADVKVQVEFNPRRVPRWRQVGYARHQLAKEQFRDNTVDAAEIGAAESGNALYLLEIDPRGDGPVGTARVRYRVPTTGVVEEHAWEIPYERAGVAAEQASPAMRLAMSAGALGESLAGSPYAAEVTASRLLPLLGGVVEAFAPDPRPAQLEAMIRQVGAIRGQ